MIQERFCWVCGNPLAKKAHAERDYFGEKILLHICCTKQFDKDEQERKITAQVGDTAGRLGFGDQE